MYIYVLLGGNDAPDINLDPVNSRNNAAPPPNGVQEEEPLMGAAETVPPVGLNEVQPTNHSVELVPPTVVSAVLPSNGLTEPVAGRHAAEARPLIGAQHGVSELVQPATTCKWWF